MSYKILIWIFAILMLSGIAYAVNTDNLYHYYSFNENTSTIAHDIISGTGLTLTNSPTWVTGRNGTAIEMDGTNQYLTNTSAPTWDGWSEISISWWQWHDNNGLDGLIQHCVNDNDWFSQSNSGTMRFEHRTTDKQDWFQIDVAEGSGNWEHYVFISNSTGSYWYRNGTLRNSDPAFGGGIIDSGTNFHIGRDMCSNNYGDYWDGKIDELGVWANYSLTPSEVTEIFNGWVYSVSDSIIIELNSPDNNTNSTQDLIANFTFSSTDNSTGNCVLMLNNTINDSITGIASGSTNNLTANDMNTGQYEWYITCNTSTIDNTNSETRLYYVDSIIPSCNFSDSYTYYNNETYEFDIECTDDHFFSLNVSCPNNNQSFYIDGLDVTSYNFTSIFNFTSEDTCNYEYCDGHTNNILIRSWDKIIRYNGIDLIADAKKIITINASKNATISFNQKNDRVSYTFDFGHNSEGNKVFTVQVPEDSYYMSSNKYLGWFVSPSQKIWIDHNNDNTNKATIVQIGKGLYEIRLRTYADTITFESSGELNCVNGNFIINEPFSFTLKTGICPSTIPDVITLFIIMIFMLSMIFFGLLFKLRFFGILGSSLLIPLSWTIIACHYFTGLVMIGIGLISLTWFMTSK